MDENTFLNLFEDINTELYNGCKYYSDCFNCIYPACVYDGYKPNRPANRKSTKCGKWTESEKNKLFRLSKLSIPISALANIFCRNASDINKELNNMEVEGLGMKLKDALNGGAYKRIEFRSYSQDGCSDFFYDMAVIENNNVVSVNTSEVYDMNENIITYDDDKKDPFKLIVWIRTIITDKVHINNNYAEEY